MKNFLRYFTGLLAAAILGFSIYGLTHTRDVLDYLALYNYEPPAQIVKLADETSMNDKTRKVFYVNRPDLQDKSSFKNSCVKQEETIVLGCYVENTGIFLLKVDDPRLDGIIEVTSAHEVLHAMYDRLSDEERAQVDKMTAKFFDNLKNDRIKSNVENYRKRDPSVVPNELHSILATEVRDLSPELEAYYSRYFKDRKAVVGLSEKYEETFIRLEDQVQAYRSQLDNLRKSLDANEQQVNSLGGQVDVERKRLDDQLNSGQVEEYNAGVAGFNGLVNRYNALIQARKSMIAEYNRIVELYNDVASTEADLLESLQVQPIQTQEGR